ncbi:MAG: hypothetical protein JWQ96_2901 [Segetibacter sp.]|nr:hypothetical protein [Segetibacter sp.]
MKKYLLILSLCISGGAFAKQKFIQVTATRALREQLEQVISPLQISETPFRLN